MCDSVALAALQSTSQMGSTPSTAHLGLFLLFIPSLCAILVSMLYCALGILVLGKASFKPNMEIFDNKWGKIICVFRNFCLSSHRICAFW
jgi:hypothetical protein